MPTVLGCPRCNIPLTPHRVMVQGKPVIVDICAAGCGGVWLDDSDMRSGIDVSDDLFDVVPDVPAPPAPDIEQPVACPMCTGPTHRYRWNYSSPVLLDQCQKGHGTWIDGGEVRAMEKWETDQTLSEADQAPIMAKVHMARLDAETRNAPGRGGQLPHPIINALQNLFHRLT